MSDGRPEHVREPDLGGDLGDGAPELAFAMPSRLEHDGQSRRGGHGKREVLADGQTIEEVIALIAARQAEARARPRQASA